MWSVDSTHVSTNAAEVKNNRCCFGNTFKRRTVPVFCLVIENGRVKILGQCKQLPSHKQSAKILFR